MNPDLRTDLPHAHRPARDDQGGMWCLACAAMCRDRCWPCDCCRVRRVIDASHALALDLLTMDGNTIDLAAWPNALELLNACGVPT